MNKSAVNLLSSFFEQLQIAQANLAESQSGRVSTKIEDYCRTFKAERLNGAICDWQDHDDDTPDTPTSKEASRSARSQSRRPLFGNKSIGGYARIVKSENGNKLFKTCIGRRGEDVYTRPDRQSQHIGGYVRGMSPAKGLHYSFPKVEDPADQQVYTTFAFKKQRKDFKKNKSRRDLIFVE